MATAAMPTSHRTTSASSIVLLAVLLICLQLATLTRAFSTPPPCFFAQIRSRTSQCSTFSSPPLYSSIFYNDFEDFDKDDNNDDDDGSKNKNDNDEDKDDDEDTDEEDDEEEEDDDDLLDTIDDAAIANFRNRMSTTFDMPAGPSEEAASDTSSSSSSAVDELISFATRQNQQATEWAKPAPELQPGVVLLANPAHFCAEFNSANSRPAMSLLSKFGLTLPPPAELGPDRRADLLPVLLVVQVDDADDTTRAVLLNRRTGYLLGDLEQPSSMAEGESSTPLLEKFCVQPLWFGGVENDGMGLDMLHQCEAVQGATPLTSDGLFWGGDPAQAQEAMASIKDRILTGFDFKFFVQSTVWKRADLQQEIDKGVWFPASVSKEVLFKSRDRMGTQRAKVCLLEWCWIACCENVIAQKVPLLCSAALERVHGTARRRMQGDPRQALWRPSVKSHRGATGTLDMLHTNIIDKSSPLPLYLVGHGAFPSFACKHQSHDGYLRGSCRCITLTRLLNSILIDSTIITVRAELVIAVNSSLFLVIITIVFIEYCAKSMQSGLQWTTIDVKVTTGIRHVYKKENNTFTNTDPHL